MRRQIPRERHFYMRSFCFLLITFLSYLFKLTGSNVHNFIVWLIVQWSVGEEERMKKKPLLSVSRSSWNCTDKSLCHLIACNAILVLFCSVVFLCRFCAQQFFVTFSIAFCSVWFAFARWMACHATQAALQGTNCLFVYICACLNRLLFTLLCRLKRRLRCYCVAVILMVSLGLEFSCSIPFTLALDIARTLLTIACSRRSFFSFFIWNEVQWYIRYHNVQAINKILIIVCGFVIKRIYEIFIVIVFTPWIR